MKINTFTSVLSFALAAIIAFFLSYYIIGDNKYVLGIGSLISLSVTLMGALSVSFEYKRTSALTRTTSSVFFILILASQIIFTIIGSFSLPSYVLITGGLIGVFFLSIYGLSRSNH